MVANGSVTGVVTPVRAAHRFDEEALARYLVGRLPGAENGIAVRQFEGGQSNPTYLLEIDHARWVLRKKPGGELLPSAHMIEREYRIMSALHGSAVPVPDVPLLCDDASVIGTPFFVMSYVHGRILRDPSLPSMTGPERTATYHAATEALAALHGVDWAARGLSDFGRPGGYVARQIARWSKQYLASVTVDEPAMTWLLAWLPEHIPAEGPSTLVHGDYRIDNLVLHPTQPTVLALLDWELSTIGDPLTDLGYFCMPYHLPAGERGLRGLIGCDLAALSIPTEAETVALYCRLRGIPVPSAETYAFYTAFAMFRIAAIAAGIAARLAAGNASSDTASDIASQVSTFATAARAIAEGRA